MKMTRLIGTYHFRVKGPFNFFLTASNYAFSWDFDGKNAYLVVNYEGEIVGAKLYELDSKIIAEFYLPNNRVEEYIDVDDVAKIVDRIFGFSEDLSSFYTRLKNDPLLNIVHEKLRGIHIRSTNSVWTAGLIGICQQNSSFYNGWRMIYNIRRILGKRAIIGHNHEYYTYPRPEDILNQKNELKATKVGYRAKTIINLAKAIKNNSDWRNVKGIGKYTKSLIEIFAFRNYNTFPVDKWFRRVIPYFYTNQSQEWSEKNILNFAKERWGEWRGLAAVLITIVTGAKPIPKIFKEPIDPAPNSPSPLTLWKYL